MKQSPSNLKFKKNHKIRKSVLILKEQKVFFPAFGEFGIQSVESGQLTLKQIEACRKSIRRNVKKLGFIKLRTFTYQSITKKSIGSRMGKGKGNHSLWICPIRRGQIICELAGINLYQSVKSLNGASSKLPVNCKIVKLKY